MPKFAALPGGRCRAFLGEIVPIEKPRRRPGHSDRWHRSVRRTGAGEYPVCGSEVGGSVVAAYLSGQVSSMRVAAAREAQTCEAEPEERERTGLVYSPDGRLPKR